MKVFSSTNAYQALTTTEDDHIKFIECLQFFSAARTYTIGDYIPFVDFVNLCIRLHEIDYALIFSSRCLRIFSASHFTSIREARAQALIENDQYEEAKELLEELLRFFAGEIRNGNESIFACQKYSQISQQIRQIQ